MGRRGSDARLAAKGESITYAVGRAIEENSIYRNVKPWLHDASNTSNVGSWKHSTDRVAEAQMTNDERPPSDVGVGR